MLQWYWVRCGVGGWVGTRGGCLWGLLLMAGYPPSYPLPWLSPRLLPESSSLSPCLPNPCPPQNPSRLDIWWCCLPSCPAPACSTPAGGGGSGGGLAPMAASSAGQWWQWGRQSRDGSLLVEDAAWLAWDHNQAWRPLPTVNRNLDSLGGAPRKVTEPWNFNLFLPLRLNFDVQGLKVRSAFQNQVDLKVWQKFLALVGKRWWSIPNFSQRVFSVPFFHSQWPVWLFGADLKLHHLDETCVRT